MPVKEEAARALTEVGRLREVLDHLRGLLAAAAAAEQKAANASEPD